MDEFIIRLLFLAGGLVIGAAAGSIYSTNNHIKRITDATEETCRMVNDLHDRIGTMEALHLAPPDKKLGWRPSPRDEKGEVSLTNVGVLLAVIIVCMSFISTLNTNANSRAATERVAATQKAQAASQIVSDRENACTVSVIFSLVDAVTPRSKYTLQSLDANITLLKAQLLFLRTPSGASLIQGMEALRTYVTALVTYLDAVQSSKSAALNNPYPKRKDYVRCLKQAREKPVSDTTGGDL